LPGAYIQLSRDGRINAAAMRRRTQPHSAVWAGGGDGRREERESREGRLGLRKQDVTSGNGLKLHQGDKLRTQFAVASEDLSIMLTLHNTEQNLMKRISKNQPFIFFFPCH